MARRNEVADIIRTSDLSGWWKLVQERITVPGKAGCEGALDPLLAMFDRRAEWRGRVPDYMRELERNPAFADAMDKAHDLSVDALRAWKSACIRDR
jgi:hypothetical protein